MKGQQLHCQSIISYKLARCSVASFNIMLIWLGLFSFCVLIMTSSANLADSLSECRSRYLCWTHPDNDVSTQLYIVCASSALSKLQAANPKISPARERDLALRHTSQAFQLSPQCCFLPLISVNPPVHGPACLLSFPWWHLILAAS